MLLAMNTLGAEHQYLYSLPIQTLDIFIGRFTASDVEFYLREAWEAACKDHKDLIVRSFGITVSLDGSEDTDINIHGHDGYIACPVKPLARGLEGAGSGDSDSQNLTQNLRHSLIFSWVKRLFGRIARTEIDYM